MQSDEEGFCYPAVNRDKCVDCGICNIVCPMLNQSQAHRPLLSLAYKNPSETERLRSSSGGLFIELANCIISQQGVVFGVTYDANWMPVHSYADNKEDIRAFMGSKYVQSRIGNSYAYAKRFLREGRIVLFSGTPCQIAGLKAFLGKDYDNLITIEIMCHGVPSPGVWKDYISKICPKGIDGQNTVLSSMDNPPLRRIKIRFCCLNTPLLNNGPRRIPICRLFLAMSFCVRLVIIANINPARVVQTSL